MGPACWIGPTHPPHTCNGVCVCVCVCVRVCVCVLAREPCTIGMEHGQYGSTLSQDIIPVDMPQREIHVQGDVKMYRDGGYDSFLRVHSYMRT